MSTCIEASKRAWTAGEPANHQEIQTGCLQRIAASLEVIQQNWDRLKDEATWNADRAKSNHEWAKKEQRKNRALRGVITKLRNRKWVKERPASS